MVCDSALNNSSGFYCFKNLDRKTKSSLKFFVLFISFEVMSKWKENAEILFIIRFI